MIMAMFALDNIAHGACYLRYEALRIRKSLTYDPVFDEMDIWSRVTPLLEQLSAWLRRPFILKTEVEENSIHIDASPHEINFVNHPPIRYRNPEYAALMAHYYAVSLFVTLVVKDGTFCSAPDRLTLAINVCRTYAIIPLQQIINGFSGKGITSTAHERIYEMFMAGLVFVQHQQWVC
jgi:hypothetical protein